MKEAIFAAIVAVASAQGDGTGGGDGGGGGGGGGGDDDSSQIAAPACASTAAGCSAYSLLDSGSCDTTAGCAAILEEDACRELHTLVDMTLCVVISLSFLPPRRVAQPHSFFVCVDQLVWRIATLCTHSDDGNGHFTIGASQQGNAAPGCINFNRHGSNRHKFNPKSDSTALCNADFQCFCSGDCAPIAAHVDPTSVGTDPGTSGTGGTGGAAGRMTQGATSPPPPASSSVVAGPIAAVLAAASAAWQL